MHSPKCRWRCEDRDIPGSQTVDRLLVRIHSSKGAVFGHINPFLELLGERPSNDVDATAKHVGHRHDLEWCIGDGECVRCSPAAATTAADQCHTDLVAATSVHCRYRIFGRRLLNAVLRPTF